MQMKKSLKNIKTRTLTSGIILSLVFVFISSLSFSQSEYKIIDTELKDKIVYDNSKKVDETKRVQIYYLYQIKISSKIETKEKMQLIMASFSQKFKLENNTFDFDQSTWNVTSMISLLDEWFKKELDIYDYHSTSISVQFALKD